MSARHSFYSITYSALCDARFLVVRNSKNAIAVLYARPRSRFPLEAGADLSNRGFDAIANFSVCVCFRVSVGAQATENNQHNEGASYREFHFQVFGWLCVGMGAKASGSGLQRQIARPASVSLKGSSVRPH